MVPGLTVGVIPCAVQREAVRSRHGIVRHCIRLSFLRSRIRPLGPFRDDAERAVELRFAGAFIMAIHRRDTVDGNDGLRPAIDAKLLQDRRHMRFHGGFGDT